MVGVVAAVFQDIGTVRATVCDSQ